MRIVCSGGGTGGHIFPAIAVAKEIKKRNPDAEVLFIGAQGKMEMTKVPKAGFDIIGLWISGFQRQLTLKNVLFPLKIISSVWKSRRILIKFKPDVVVGFGGYASGAALWAASKMGIPTLVQEQNSYAGITNKMLGKSVDRVCVAYEQAKRFFPVEKVILTGNPVRSFDSERDSLYDAYEILGLKSGLKTILIIGGSLGARSINRALRELNLEISKLPDTQVLWQCGSLYIEEFSTCETAQLKNVQITDFIEDMDAAYSIADVVVCRAGALTLSELMVIGKAAILVPSPNVAEDHQTMNAKALVENNAAILLKDVDLEDGFISSVTKVLNDETRRQELENNIRSLAKPKATLEIVNEIEKLIKK